MSTVDNIETITLHLYIKPITR